MKDVVYQVSAYEYTPKQAADEFARKWFDRPRQVDRFVNNRFCLVDGVAEYEVIRVPEVPLVSGPLWQIVRLLTQRAADECPICNGKGMRGTGESYRECGACHGTGTRR